MWKAVPPAVASGRDIQKAFTLLVAPIPVVLVALFVQKSGSHSSLRTVLLLSVAVLGWVLVALGIVAIRFSRRVHRHKWAWFFASPRYFVPSILVGLVATLVPFAWIDKEDSDFTEQPALGEETVDAGGLALRDITVAERPGVVRITAALINTTKAPATVDNALIAMASDQNTIACDGTSPIYSIEDNIVVENGKVNATVAPKSGPLSGFTVPATGDLARRRAARRPQTLLPLVYRQGARPTHERTTHRPRHPPPRPRDGHLLYKRYFDLIAAGVKTTEIRVNDSSRQKIVEGSLIRFRCRDDEVLTRVTHVTRYPSFDDMFDHESVTHINPTATREEQLANVRQIYPPEREALGVVAIGIELVDPPHPPVPTAGVR